MNVIQKIDPHGVYSVRDVAKILGTNDQTIIEYCRLRMIPAVKIKQWTILGKSLLDYLQKSRSERVEDTFKSFTYQFQVIFNGTDWGLSSRTFIQDHRKKDRVTVKPFTYGTSIISNRFATKEEAIALGKKIVEKAIEDFSSP